MYPPPPPPPGSPPPPGYPPGYPPPGYPPQQPYGYAPYGYAPMPVKPGRSAIPRVIGVLGIIFACFGLIGSAIWSLGPLTDIDRMYRSDLGPIKTWLYVWLVLSLGIFVIHLIGGIFAVQYKASGLKLMTYYAISALVLIVIDVILVNVLIPAHYRDVGGEDGVWFSVRTMHLVFSFMAAPWPIIALALSRNPRAKEACNAGAMQQATSVF